MKPERCRILSGKYLCPRTNEQRLSHVPLARAHQHPAVYAVAQQRVILNVVNILCVAK
jgi:hypothetical protein